MHKIFEQLDSLNATSKKSLELDIPSFVSVAWCYSVGHIEFRHGISISLNAAGSNLKPNYLILWLLSDFGLMNRDPEFEMVDDILYIKRKSMISNRKSRLLNLRRFLPRGHQNRGRGTRWC